MTKVEMRAIIEAIKSGHLDYMIELSNETMDWQLTRLNDGHYNILPIHQACRYGQLEIVQLLLEKKPDLLNSVDAFNYTPVHFAAVNGHSLVVDYLANLGADLTIATNGPNKECHGYLPIHWAAENGHHKVVQCLINHGVDIHMRLGEMQYHLIHIASKKGQLEVVKILLNQNPDLLNITDGNGQTPLLWAAVNNHEDLVDYLATAGADLTIATNDPNNECHGYLPIHWAAENGHHKVVQCLINHGADIHMRLGEMQYHLIHIASKKGQLEVVKILLNQNPDLLNITDANGQTSLAKALEGKHFGLSSCLILKTTANQSRDMIFPFIADGVLALYLMKLDPTLTSIFLQDDRIASLIKKTAGCCVTQESIDWYKIAGRRPSFFVSINLETETSTVFNPVRELGKGSNGVVRLFQNAENQEIGVKSLKDHRVALTKHELNTQTQKLQREAEFNKRAYPNDHMCKTFEFNRRHGNQRRYTNRYLMPYIKGETAGLLIPKITCPYQLAEITLQTVRELQRIHHIGIIHSDLSYSNIMIHCENKQFFIRLIDFGCSTFLTDLKATTFNSEGTAKWYAPEVINAIAPIKPNPNQDVYSLGFSLNRVLVNHASYQELMRLFPSIGVFIAATQSINPLDRPSLESFCAQLSNELDPKTKIDLLPNETATLPENNTTITSSPLISHHFSSNSTKKVSTPSILATNHDETLVRKDGYCRIM